jgi:HEAT repeat protein
MLRNAHQVSFFALREKIRAQAKEFVEGVARPLGALGGTLLLLLMQQIWHHRELTLALNLTLVATGIVMLLLVSKLSKMHTLLARKNLERHGAPQEKLEAIEVLAQKGHENAAEILIKELAFRKDEPEVKISIIKTLGLLRDPSALPEILRHFDDNSREVQLAAVQSLSNFENLGANFLTQAFARYRVTRALKRLFLQTPSKKVKVAAIKSFTNIKGAEVVPFLLKTLSSEDDQIRSEGVYACGLFRDPTVSYYLEEYLNDHSPRVRSNAIIALWQFVAMRLRLLVQLTSLLESKEPDELMSGIYAVGEIGFTQEVPRLIKLLEHDNPEIRRHAALALGKVNHSASVEHIVEFIWQENHQKALHFQRQTHSLHPQIHRQVSNLVLHGAAKRVTEILRNEGTEILEEISEKTLVELLHIFAIIEADKEALQVRNELERRHKVAKKEQAAKESPKPSLSSKSLAQAIISGPSVQG